MTGAALTGVGGFLLLTALKAEALLLAAAAAARCLRGAAASLRHAVRFAGIVAVLALPGLSLLAPGWPGLEWWSPSSPGSGTLRGSAGVATVAIGAVWAAGAAFLLLRLVLRTRVARRRLAAVEETRDARILSVALDARRELRFRGAVRVLLSRDTAVPFSFAVLHSRVVLPDAARAWSPARLRAVLLHELAHLARRDGWTQLAAEVACALYWFLPPVWWAARSMRLTRELACDDRVLTRGARPSGYARLLLSSWRAARDEPPSAAAALADRHELERRIRAVLDPRRPRRSARGTFVAAALGALLLVVAVAAAGMAGAAPTHRRHTIHVHAESHATAWWSTKRVTSEAK